MVQLISVIKEKKAFKYKEDSRHYLFLSEYTLVMRNDEGEIKSFPCGDINIIDGKDKEIYDYVKDVEIVERMHFDTLKECVDDYIDGGEDDALNTLDSVLWTISESGISIDDETREYLVRIKKFVDTILANNR